MYPYHLWEEQKLIQWKGMQDNFFREGEDNFEFFICRKYKVYGIVPFI